MVASGRRAIRDAAATAVAGVVVAGAAATVLGGAYPASTATLVGAAALGTVPALASAVAVLRRRPRTSTPADRVTLTRSVLASGCAAVTVMVLAGSVPARTWWLLALAVPALLLDAADGLVARRTGSVSVAGARLDMQVDAGFLVVLSVAVAPVLGGWVLLIGAMRYLFVAASWLRPALAAPLARSEFRRAVAGLQGAMLAVAIAPVVPLGAATVAVLFALALLLVSFGRDVVTLERRVRALTPGMRPGSMGTPRT